MVEEGLGQGEPAYSWLLGDNLGTIRDVVNPSGSTVTDHIDYDAFGQVKSQTNPSQMPDIGFTGRLRDQLTGLQWNGGQSYVGMPGGWSPLEADTGAGIIQASVSG
jgi:hypothetical protein